MHVIFIHNPGAGSGDIDIGRIRRDLKAAGHSVSEVSSDAQDWRARIAQPADLVLVAGGDGTIASVAKAMVGRNVTLAALAAGTANNIAHTLGIESMPPGEQIAAWSAGRRMRFDVATAIGPWGEERVIEGFGCGLFASSMSRVDETLDKEGEVEPAYRLAQAQQLMKERVGAFPTTRVEASLDDHDISGDYIVFEAMNIRFVGPNLFLAPDADPGDGLLDVVLVDSDGRNALGEHLGSWQRGAKEAPVFRCERGRVLKLRWTGFDLHLDDRVWPPEDAPQRRDEAQIELHLGGDGVDFLIP